MRLALSTAACSARMAADELLAHWRRLAGEAITSLAIDRRLAGELRRELLSLLPRHGLGCAQLTYPALVGRRPPPSPVSEDREERLAVRQGLIQTLQLAADRSVGAVLLLPVTLPLQPAPGLLARRFAEGRELPLGGLREARLAQAPRLIDRLCDVLDRVVGVADRLRTRLLLPVPSAWPHQVPDLGAARRLCEIFAGAPLACAAVADWAHCAGALGQPDEIERTTSVRLADACGLASGLPLGTGEVDWAAWAPRLADAEEAVLTLGEGVRPEEVRRSVALIDGLVAARQQ